MKIAYNPETAAALTAAPSNNDITFDLKGIAIYAKGVKFKGTDTTYSVFKKHTSNNKGGYNGLVPVPSYTTTTTRYLREDGTWVVPTNTTYTFTNGTTGNFTVTPSGGTAQTVSIGKPVTAGTADTADKLTTSRKLWGQDFDGSANVLGDMTGVGNITVNATGNKDYFINFLYNSTPLYSWRLGYLRSGSGNANYFVIDSSKSSGGTWHRALQIGNETLDATFAGIVTSPTFIGNLDGIYVNTLTGYTKSTTASNIVATDTLNTALGKLEYKAHYAYNWITSVTATDTDEYINKWGEIVDFINSVKEGTNILDEFVTITTDLTIIGVKTFDNTVLVRRAHTDENYYGVRLLGSEKIGYLLLGQFTGSEKLHKGAITSINNTNLTSLEVKSSNTNFSGNIATNTLVISNTKNAKHILFSRGSETDHPYNYIAAPAGGIISILPNGVTNASTSGMQFSTNGFHPATTQTYALGTSSLRWSSLYSNIGSFSGNVTALGFIKTNSSDSYVLLGGGSHKALSDFLLETEFASKELSSNLTTITKTIKLTKEWQDTGISINSTNFTNGSGTYIVQVYINAGDAAGFWLSYFSGIMSAYVGVTNAAVPDDEIILHHASHDCSKQIYLKTKPVAGSTDHNKLYIACNTDCNSAVDIVFKFKKLI